MEAEKDDSQRSMVTRLRNALVVKASAERPPRSPSLLLTAATSHASHPRRRRHGNARTPRHVTFRRARPRYDIRSRC